MPQSGLRLCIDLPLCQRPGPLQLLDLLDQLELLNDLVLQSLLQVVQLVADGLQKRQVSFLIERTQSHLEVLQVHDLALFRLLKFLSRLGRAARGQAPVFKQRQSFFMFLLFDAQRAGLNHLWPPVSERR